jgi:hypothetical protein
MALRHAGSPVSAPERLSRARQDAILLVAVMSCRAEMRRELLPLSEIRQQNIASFRAALRLDDPVLDDIIARGDHRQPWHSSPDRDRANPGTMDSIARKYGG